MWTKRLLLFVVSLALFASAVGCGHHRCCKTGGVSYAAPARDCCP